MIHNLPVMLSINTFQSCPFPSGSTLRNVALAATFLKPTYPSLQRRAVKDSHKLAHGRQIIIESYSRWEDDIEIVPRAPQWATAGEKTALRASVVAVSNTCENLIYSMHISAMTKDGFQDGKSAACHFACQFWVVNNPSL